MIRVGLLLAMLPTCIGGCSLVDSHAKQLDLVRGLAVEAAQRVGEGTGQYATGGQVINPGVAVEASIVYRALARFEGVAGQSQAAASGALTPQTDQRAEAVLRIINDASLEADKRRELILELIRSWQTTPSPKPTG